MRKLFSITENKQELFFSWVYLLAIMWQCCVEGTASVAQSFDTPPEYTFTWLYERFISEFCVLKGRWWSHKQKKEAEI